MLSVKQIRQFVFSACDKYIRVEYDIARLEMLLERQVGWVLQGKLRRGIVKLFYLLYTQPEDRRTLIWSVRSDRDIAHLTQKRRRSGCQPANLNTLLSGACVDPSNLIVELVHIWQIINTKPCPAKALGALPIPND